ncbi:MAG: hypothetical protein IPM60_02910 [Rhodospirillales bacterium]|nr:hypothetical protein [Rhodospirillales bacterium]
MSGALLRTGGLQDFHALGAVGNPVHSAASQLRAAMRRQLGEDVANLFAIPKQNQRGDAIDWYAPTDGNVVPWSAATPEERAEAKAALLAARERLEEKSRALQQEGDTERQIFGKLLAQATRIPSDEHVYLVDGSPVMTFWGFTERGAQPGYDVIGSLDAGHRSASVLPAAVPDAAYDDEGEGLATGPVAVEERRRRPWWMWLLLIPLLLLLLALLLFGLQECGYYDVRGLLGLAPDKPPVIEETLEEPGVDDRTDQVEIHDGAAGLHDRDTVVDRDTVIDRGVVIDRDGTATTTVIDRDGGGVVDDGIVGDQAVTGDTGTAVEGDAAALPPEGEAAIPDAEGAGAEGEQPLAEGEATAEPDAGAPTEPDAGAPAEPDPGAPADAPVPADEQAAPSEASADAPVPPELTPPPGSAPPGSPPEAAPGAPPPDVSAQPGASGSAAPASDPLRIPAGAAAQGSTQFLDGQWRSVTGLQDAEGRPMQLQYQFKDGQGTANLRYQVGSEQRTCSAPVNSQMKDGKLVIEGQQDFRCPDGRTFQRSRVECTPGEQGRARCRGVNQDGSSYGVRIVK